MKQGYLFDVKWSDDDAGYIATCESFLGLSAYGEDEISALLQGYVALGGFVESCLQHGNILPEPWRSPYQD